MIHPDLPSPLNDAHRRELLRQARQERLVAGASASRETAAERFLHWISGGLADAAFYLENLSASALRGLRLISTDID